MFDMTLLGTSGMCPLPNRALAACFVRVVDKGFLIDAGEGTQVELMRNKIATSSIDYVLITHMHADHISGLLGIFLAMQMQGRTNDLKIIGPKGIHNYINSFSPFIRGLGFRYDVEEIKSPTSYLIPVQSANLFINDDLPEFGIPITAALIERPIRPFSALLANFSSIILFTVLRSVFIPSPFNELSNTHSIPCDLK